MMDGGNNMVEVAPEGLSEDIVIEILLRLPVKSLLRFKTVCKSWNLIISSTWFIREHLKLAHAARYNQHKDFLGILNAVLFKDDSDGLMLAKEFDVPTENFVGSEEIWARNSCDGLICFQTEHANTVVIWNPSLPTECKVIDSDFVVSCGIGYDPCTDDYKIVGLPCISFDESPCAYISVQHFSLKRGSWRTLRMTKTMDFEILNTKVTYTKNRLYWLGISEDEDEDEDWTYFIVYFDLVEERLNCLNIPSLPNKDVILLNYKESLASAFRNSEGEEEIWVLQDSCGMKSSWSKLFKFSCSYSWPLDYCFTLKGELLNCYLNRLIIVDPNDGSLKDVMWADDYVEDYDYRCIFTSPYVESLVSPTRLQ